MSRVKNNLFIQISSCEYIFNVFVDINFIHDTCKLMKKAGPAAVLFFTPLQADFDLVVYDYDSTMRSLSSESASCPPPLKRALGVWREEGGVEAFA